MNTADLINKACILMLDLHSATDDLIREFWFLVYITLALLGILITIGVILINNQRKIKKMLQELQEQNNAPKSDES